MWPHTNYISAAILQECAGIAENGHVQVKSRFLRTFTASSTLLISKLKVPIDHLRQSDSQSDTEDFAGDAAIVSSNSEKAHLRFTVCLSFA